MDDDSKEFVRAGMEVMLSPFASVIDNVIGIAGGDWLQAIRDKRNAERPNNQAETLRVASKLIHERDVKPDPDTNKEKIAEILEAAQDETDARLRELYAALLAAALDPKRASLYRREFVDIVKRLEPLDVIVLPLLNTTAQMPPNRMTALAVRLNRNADEIELSFRNLLRLELVWQNSAIAVTPLNPTPGQPVVTALGKQLLAIVAP